MLDEDLRTPGQKEKDAYKAYLKLLHNKNK